MKSEFDFAIAVCTYNPNPVLLERLFTAIQALLTTVLSIEIVLVDNNSSPALITLPTVQNFLSKTAQARCVVEPQQGLAIARCRAVRETTASIVVFFDDDNEPNCDYLQVLDCYFKKYPNVGVWGPGQIAVEYIDQVEAWFHQHPEFFQQRQLEFGYTCVPAFLGTHSPNGTGFAARRNVLQQYVFAVEQGALRTTGRKGNSLSSAEDSQIVWESTKLGFAVGMIPELRCKHLITVDKANFTYLKRLHFGVGSSYVLALDQSFPQHLAKWGKPPTMVQVYVHLIKFWIDMALHPQQQGAIQLRVAKAMGGWYGHASALQAPHADQILRLAERFHLTS